VIVPDRIKENAKCIANIKCQQSESGPVCLFVWQDYHSPVGMKDTKNCGCESLYICVALEINECIVQKCLYDV